VSLRDHRLPLLLAAVVTLLNAAKPAVVDDTAYLLCARHISADPLHPYGFDLFWYYRPEPAMEVLAPPVLPYWLAAGMAVFGENLILLKLWLFPFAWVLCLSVRSLLRRFSAGVEREGLIAFALSPAVLPLFSVMLDVPALALGAAAVALFVKGCDDVRWWWCVLAAGVCCALAMQTKYTMLTVPCVLVGYAFTRLGKPNSVLALVYLLAALIPAVGLFAGWEWFMVRQHDQSHFLFHLKGNAGEGKPLWETLKQRFGNAPPLLGQFGGLACGVSLAASAGIGWPRWVRIPMAVVVGLLVALICALPYSLTTPLGPKYDLSFLTFAACGVSVIATAGFGIGRALWKKAADADTLFLVGWVLVEVVGMLGMTPFVAARRVVGVCLAVAVLLFHLVSKLGNGQPVVPKWGVGFAVGLGLLIYAVDCWDALPEKVLAEKAAEVAKPEPGQTVWFTGHWGFQWHCEQAGMRHLVPWRGGTPMKAGDWLVTPVPPDENWFYRPCPFNTTEPTAVYVDTGEPVWLPENLFPRPDMKLERVADWTWQDGLSGSTIPTMYGGGSAPLKGRDRPRLRLAVYRVLEDWRP
jgi:4-amino-4-deoxy-L-arabinose transferase-like glycosyltransferase